MSGPIVRKYGFPNFDEIFGKRELEHGVEEPSPEKTAEKGAEAKDASAPKKSSEKPGAST